MTTHPFCSGSGPAIAALRRGTTRSSSTKAFFGVLHEAGHGIYEQGLPRALRHAARAASVRSAFTNRNRGCGRTRSVAAGHSGNTSSRAPAGVSRRAGRRELDDFHFAINDVRPWFIRVEADEATYNLHIILRFELELALMTGRSATGRLSRRVERAVPERCSI